MGHDCGLESIFGPNITLISLKNAGNSNVIKNGQNALKRHGIIIMIIHF